MCLVVICQRRERSCKRDINKKNTKKKILRANPVGYICKWLHKWNINYLRVIKSESLTMIIGFKRIIKSHSPNLT